MTDIEKFVEIMRKKGFEYIGNNGNFGQMSVYPYHRKDLDGNHNIIRNITFTLFAGTDTKKGKLGCVCFYCIANQRNKYCKNAYDTELFKLAFCPYTVKEAVEKFDKWKENMYSTLFSWTVIL